MTQSTMNLSGAVTPHVLRPYQTACLQKLQEYKQAGRKRALVVMATGLGKTVVFSRLPQQVPGRMLVLAHREELLDQAAGKVVDANPDLSIGIEQADRRAPPGTDVVVASIQTLNMNRKRLDGLDPTSFGSVVLDEAHHSTAPSYLSVLAHFGLAPAGEELRGLDLDKKELREESKRLFREFKIAEGAPFLTGWTATPGRTDKHGLEYVFDDLVFSMGIREGIEQGYLCEIHGQRVETAVDISEVKTRAGDFAEGELAKTVNTPQRNDLVVSAYLQYAKGLRTLVFGVDVRHAIDLRDAFHDAGIKAAVVVGETPPEERRRTIDAFRRGDIQVLTNCNVATEGFDVPEIACLIMARPTKSQLVYAQQLGRGTRPLPGIVDGIPSVEERIARMLASQKPHLLLLDIVDVARLGIMSLNTMFGLPPKLVLNGGSVLGARRDLDELENQVPMEDLLQATSVEQVKTMAEKFDPLRVAAPEYWLKRRYAWVKIPSGYALGIPAAQDGSAAADHLGIIVNMLGHAELRRKPAVGRSEDLGYFHAIQDAIDAGERWVQSHRADAAWMLNAKASWRTSNALPTERQLWKARHEGVKLLDQETVLYRALRAGDEEAVKAIEEAYSGRTKGQISMLIDQAISKKGA